MAKSVSGRLTDVLRLISTINIFCHLMPFLAMLCDFKPFNAILAILCQFLPPGMAKKLCQQKPTLILNEDAKLMLNKVL